MFRGGLTADLRRLLPIECSGEVMRPQAILPGLPLTVRPYIPSDEEAVSNICICVRELTPDIVKVGTHN